MRNNTFDPTFALDARKQHFAITGKAANTYIRADSNNAPCVTATRMLFTHLHNIADC
jgi:hypothetical protein